MDKYFNTLINYKPSDTLPESMKISNGPNGLSTYYSPFDYINKGSKLVICGITPGLAQAKKACQAFSDALSQGYSLSEGLQKAKSTASFAGQMRNNIAAMLDHIRINEVLGIAECKSIFSVNSNLVHYTSALRYPVFKNGSNYSGGGEMVTNPYLWNQTKICLGEEIDALKDAIWIPLGESVCNVFKKFVSEGKIKENHVLIGLPHPSGANAERIKYFLNIKAIDDLSTKVNPGLIDERKKTLNAKIEGLFKY